MSNDANTISMEAFEDYWGGAPSIKNVVRQLVPEESSRIQAFLSGDADLVEFPSREVVETQVAGQPGVEIYDNITNLGAYGFTMNQQLEGSTNIGSGTWGTGFRPTSSRTKTCGSASFTLSTLPPISRRCSAAKASS
ncbi:ABC transporter substrate-binding protein [Deinococcus radiophilus]|uniref:ABC transporter substrate-binding protein n=1 Tax=Deinococcus radiophilus TaxID=32062 RepID=UPI0036197D35